MNAALDKMIKARADLVLDHPFFATLALRLEFRADQTCATAWSDGVTLGYNPAYIGALPLAVVKGMQCHEVLHLACGHHTRRGQRDPGLWNRACDLAINPILLAAGLELPRGYLDDPAYHGQSADAIYERLLRDLEESRGGADSGAEQDAAPDEDMDAAGGGAPSLGGQDRAGAAGRAEDQAPGFRQAAGGGGRAAGPGDNADPGMSGEVRDAPQQALNADGDQAGPDQDDEWRMALAQAARVASEAGTMPAGLERLITSMLAPRLGWWDLLRRFLTNAARNDFSWVRPNRRYIHAGLYLPGLDSLELATIAVAVDVSGSVDHLLLEAFAAEISAVLEEFDAVVEFMTCDLALTSHQTLNRQDLPLSIRTTGGGGTDLRPPFEHLRQEGIDPACLVYFTDLQCQRFPDEPEFPVLWVSPVEPAARPPFGVVVVMEHG